MELDPQVVFERLFGSGATSEVRAARMRQSRSILDSVLVELHEPEENCRRRRSRQVNQYTEEIREIERRLQTRRKGLQKFAFRNESGLSAFRMRSTITSNCISISTALAFQADITRVVTLLGARDLTGKRIHVPRRTTVVSGRRQPA